MKFFYNFCLKDDDTALDGDILSGVRRGYFSDFQKIRDRITINSDSDSTLYDYSIEKDKPIKWSVTKDKTVLEEVKLSDSGKYYIYFYKEQQLYKRILFSRLHTLLRVEYFDLPTGLQMISLEPRKAQNGLCILYDSRFTPQPIVLYPMTEADDERLRRRAEQFDDYTVKASTDEGIIKFLSEEQEKAFRTFIEEAARELEKETEESFVGGSAPLFDKINAKDFNVKRNLATSLDITKAPEFSFAPEEPAAETEEAESDEEAEAAAVAAAAAAAINEAISASQSTAEEPEETAGDAVPAEDMPVDTTPVDISDDADDTADAAETQATAKPAVDTEPAPAEDEPAPLEAEPVSELAVKPDKLIMADGAVYSYYGELDANGNRSGYGRTVTENGRTAYEGRYLNDKRSGPGSYYYKNGTLCYTGDWVENARHGVGVGVRSGDGSIHVGRWALNKPQGSGVRITADGEIKFVCKELSDGSTALMNYLPDDTVVITKYDPDGKKIGEKTVSLTDISE